MKNNIKYFLTVILFLVIVMPSFAVKNFDSSVNEEMKALQDTYKEYVTDGQTPLQESKLDEDVDEPVVIPNIPHKDPISKKKLAKKFLLAMFAVGVSSLTLYFGLNLYNKIREGSFAEAGKPSNPALESPDTMNSAVKTFINKTHWE